MIKKITIITLAAFLLLFQGFFTLEVFANKNNELKSIQQERKKVLENLSVQEQKVNKLYDEMQALYEEVSRLENLLLEKQSQVEEITYEIETTVEEISILQDEIEELNTSIEQRFELLKTRASSYQKSGGLINYIEVLFGSQSFGDFISRLTAVNQIMDSDAALMEQLESDMELVEAYQLETMGKLDQLNELQAEQEAELARMETEKNEQEQVKVSLENTQQELIAYVNQLAVEDSRLQSVENKVKTEIAEAAEKEREERERRRLAALEAEKQKEKEQQAKVASNQGSELVQVAKVEEKVSKTQSKPTEASTPPAKKQQSKQPKQAKEPKQQENKKTITVSSTAYTANCKGCSGITSTGINLNKNPNSKVIAVDPSVIPLGSVVHVEGYGYAIAGDTGGSIRGNKIDVFFPNKNSAMNWGVRKVKVTVQ